MSDTSASPTSFPATIPVKQLLECHPEYNPRHPVCDCGVLQFYHDLYAAGIDFERNKGTYLRARGLDKVKGGENYRKARLASAHYTPFPAGIIDSIIGALMKAPPRLDGPADDPRTAYYKSLNDNSDGCGRDLALITYNLFIQMFLHRRPYLSVYFPGANAASSTSRTMADAKSNGALDARITYLNAATVDDWETEDEELKWVRTHVIDEMRSTTYGPRDIKRHTWAFINDGQIQEYVAKEEVQEDGSKKMPENATRQNPEAHGLGALPVIPVEIERSFWVMNRLASTALALFNREASLEFALDAGALNLPVLASQVQPADVMLSELGCLSVGVEGSFSFVSPDGAMFAALTTDADRLNGNLYSSIHAMALMAASQQENARQSGTAKQFDKEPMQALMRLFAAPVLDALKKAVKIIAKYRGEENLEIKVVGLDEFDTQAIELEINKAAKFNAIPGMQPQAINEMNKRLVNKVMPDAPTAVIDSFKHPYMPEIAKAVINGDMSAEIRSPKTNEPQGFGASQVRTSFTQTR